MSELRPAGTVCLRWAEQNNQIYVNVCASKIYEKKEKNYNAKY